MLNRNITNRLEIVQNHEDRWIWRVVATKGRQGKSWIRMMGNPEGHPTKDAAKGAFQRRPRGLEIQE